MDDENVEKRNKGRCPTHADILVDIVNYILLHSTNNESPIYVPINWTTTCTLPITKNLIRNMKLCTVFIAHYTQCPEDGID